MRWANGLTKWLLLTLLFPWLSAKSQLASWSFENITSDLPSLPIASSQLGSSIAAASANLSGAQNNGSPPVCSGLETWATNFWPSSSSRSLTSYMAYSITAAQGFRATITGVSFQMSRSSSNAAADYYMTIVRWGAETLIGTGAIPASGCGTISRAAATTGTSGGPLEVRIYLYRANSAALAATVRIDEVVISGSTEVALPVSMGEFMGRCGEDDRVELRWETYSERNNHGFRIQEAGAALVFNDRDFVRGHGDSQERREYLWRDAQQAPGLRYFRLKQLDYDGQSAFSPIIAIPCASGELAVIRQGNRRFSLSLGNQAGQYKRWKLLGMNGETLSTGNLEGKMRSLEIGPLELHPGLYLIVLEAEGKWLVRKILWSG